MPRFVEMITKAGFSVNYVSPEDLNNKVEKQMREAEMVFKEIGLLSK